VMASVNLSTLVVMQIETVQALAELDQLLAVRGVDIALVGPNDLSIALGVPGEVESDQMKAAISTVIEACRKHRVVPAIHVNSPQLAAFWIARGMRMVSVGSEMGMLAEGARRIAALKPPQAPATPAPK